jgi:hypothetical protein
VTLNPDLKTNEMEYVFTTTLLLAYLVSNIVALLILWSSWKIPLVGRMLYVVLFGWACWVNATASLKNPKLYLYYATTSWLPFYRSFIEGFFSRHIPELVMTIAICQGFIALALLIRGVLFRLGTIGAMVFLVSIAPFGIGSAFPCTLLLAAGLWMLLRKGEDRYNVWQVRPRNWQQKAVAGGRI